MGINIIRFPHLVLRPPLRQLHLEVRLLEVEGVATEDVVPAEAGGVSEVPERAPDLVRPGALVQGGVVDQAGDGAAHSGVATVVDVLGVVKGDRLLLTRGGCREE